MAGCQFLPAWVVGSDRDRECGGWGGVGRNRFGWKVQNVEYVIGTRTWEALSRAHLSADMQAAERPLRTLSSHIWKLRCLAGS